MSKYRILILMLILILNSSVRLYSQQQLLQTLTQHRSQLQATMRMDENTLYMIQQQTKSDAELNTILKKVDELKKRKWCNKEFIEFVIGEKR